jgi:deoxyribodipyrimidine photo-lyase
MYEVKKPPLLFEESKMAQASETPTKFDGMNALLEEMVVRKELSDNFCFYNDNYDKLEGAEQWAKNSLKEHESDKRDFTYSRDEFENAKTHDKSWNAAQLQLRKTGKIHGYMRMYWAKKILEWTENAETAIEYAIYLNDKYSIDGGDPNGYVGVLWSIAGVHDRPWIDRQVFGKIRYMNEGGLKRKFDLDKYINKWIN